MRRPRPLFRDATDHVGDTTDSRATVWRWRPAYQNDFQARMDWCVLPYDKANHPPVAVLGCKPEMTVTPGTIVKVYALKVVHQ